MIICEPYLCIKFLYGPPFRCYTEDRPQVFLSGINMAIGVFGHGKVTYLTAAKYPKD